MLSQGLQLMQHFGRQKEAPPCARTQEPDEKLSKMPLFCDLSEAAFPLSLPKCGNQFSQADKAAQKIAAQMDSVQWSCRQMDTRSHNGKCWKTVMKSRAPSFTYNRI